MLVLLVMIYIGVKMSITWMVLILFADTNKIEMPVDKVDFFELSHVYDDKGRHYLDQVILWEWVTHKIYNKEKMRYDTRLDKRVVIWYSLPKSKYREVLTPVELRRKNQELAEEWRKLYGLKYVAPDYNPKFLGGVGVPRYDPFRKTWVVIITYKHVLRKFYGNGYIETWLQTDPEVENQEVFPTHTRRQIFQGIK